MVCMTGSLREFKRELLEGHNQFADMPCVYTIGLMR